MTLRVAGDLGLLRLVLYDRARHYPALCAWYEGHGLEPEPEWALPRIGLIAEDGTGEGLAGCWMHQMDETGIWFLDFMIRNPFADKAAANAGLDAVIGALEAEIQRRGGRCAGGITGELAVVQRLRKLGWKVRRRNWFFMGKLFVAI